MLWNKYQNKKKGDNMLVLFKGESKGTVSLAPKEFFELAGKQAAMFNGYKQQGKILAGGIIAGGRGSYAIFDVDSFEELQGLIAQTPLFPFVEIEFIPLVSYEFASESAKKLA
jgi:muconolactone delta-isomerase